MYESINEALRNNFYENPEIEKALVQYEERVLDGSMESFIAAGQLLDIYKQQKQM